MYFSLDKLINFKGNRYELAAACMAYAKKVRFVSSREYKQVEHKDALVALKNILNEDIKYLMDENEEQAEDDLDEEAPGAPLEPRENE